MKRKKPLRSLNLHLSFSPPLKLESDGELKKKLSSIARDKEIDDLKKLVYKTSDEDNEVYGRPVSYQDSTSKKIYQKFIPYDGNNNFKYNNMENEVYYYQNNDVKRSKDMM